MKHLFLFLLLAWSVLAGDITQNYEFSPKSREYFFSVQQGMKGLSAWRSSANIPLSTAAINSTTTTKYFAVHLIDTSDDIMHWYTAKLAGFSVTSTPSVTNVTHGAVLSASTLSFIAGSAGCSVVLTGVWSIGNTVTVSFPLLSAGVISAAKASQILTFTE